MDGPLLPEVSVIVPTRNRQSRLERTLNSVLVQEDVDFELIVVDEASTDSTWRYLNSHPDRRIHAISHHTAQGVAAARNAGLARAQGPFVAFLDDDDLWAPTKLVRQVERLRADTDAGWSCTGSAVVDENLIVQRLHPPPDPVGMTAELLSHNSIPGGGSGVLARTDLVRSVGCFDTAFSNLADWDLWIRLALASPMAAVAAPLVASVIHGSAASDDVVGSMKELILLRRKHADACEAAGVALGGWASGRYRAESHLRAGRRLSAAVIELRHAARYGRARSIPWVLMAVVAPGSLGRRDVRKVVRDADPALLAANTWLANVGSVEVPPAAPVSVVVDRS